MNNFRNKNKAFTFVELVIVATIITILSTIWYVSYNSYISESRDTSRISQIVSIYKALESYRVQSYMPAPYKSVDILASWSLFAYQGYAWEDVLNKIWYQDEWVDPKDKVYFTYYLTKDFWRAELMTFLENNNLTKLSGIQTYATDYKDRFPKVYWNKLGILLEKDTNTPVQEISSIIVSWLDVILTNNNYTAYINDWYSLTWTWSMLAFLRDWAWKSCWDILIKNPWLKWSSWSYYVNPNWTWSYKVNCQMTGYEN